MVLEIDPHTMTLYCQYKTQLHFTQSSDTQFVQFLLNTTVSVSDLLKHLAPTFKNSIEKDIVKEKAVIAKKQPLIAKLQPLIARKEHVTNHVTEPVTVKEEMIEQPVVELGTDITPQIDQAMENVCELKRKLDIGGYFKPQKRSQVTQGQTETLTLLATPQQPTNTLSMLENELESVLASLSSHKKTTVGLASHDTSVEQHLVSSRTSRSADGSAKPLPLLHGTTYNTKGSYKRYTDETLHKAVHMVQAGEMTQSQASKLFDIPRQTLQYRIYKYKKRYGEYSGLKGGRFLHGKSTNVIKKSGIDSNRCLQQSSNLHVIQQHNHIRTVLQNLYNKNSMITSTEHNPNSMITSTEHNSNSTLHVENSDLQQYSGIGSSMNSNIRQSTDEVSERREPYTLPAQNVEKTSEPFILSAQNVEKTSEPFNLSTQNVEKTQEPFTLSAQNVEKTCESYTLSAQNVENIVDNITELVNSRLLEGQH